MGVNRKAILLFNNTYFISASAWTSDYKLYDESKSYNDYLN